uniref:Uncharacterized protein n=1 Tax=Odontella aurita TaxID=265563 RepID=A0A7S4MBX2_9STRA|mmetsp:Transcript_17047/g.49199  ORF Transcript_17047/g.49199 Transcript_17047/m.49199 type:complete len:195 (+) Transcript_17047:65-649(+)|eukprot:CAMPEP_0113529718 /NCGR_PEP_ID=MMETSP0015_2-20120614/2546_1 /TAXON_ID=2838 /ORGANISM="Odontella" /LENGTH=194 /DNA_ID=CAMNT_0000428373 /DNA_START=24 /DNA_END=608 /DNA_ORIENTATION=- /assembly_acc=CAM_ASM_000160
MKTAVRSLLLVALAAGGRLAAAFAPSSLPAAAFPAVPSSSSSSSSTASASALNMAIQYDPSTQRWEATDEGDFEGSYGPVGSLIRAGPKPFLIRLFNADSYEQAVLKYMSKEKVGRMEAQGNMDAYFENPNDWAYQKTVELRGGYKRDWATANTDPKQVTLSTIWAGVVVWFFYGLITDSLNGKYEFQNLFDLL